MQSEIYFNAYFQRRLQAIPLNLVLYYYLMKNETGIEAIPFKCIPPKSPDVSSMDYCAFRILKPFSATFQNTAWTLEDCEERMKQNQS